MYLIVFRAIMVISTLLILVSSLIYNYSFILVILLIPFHGLDWYVLFDFRLSAQLLGVTLG